MHDVTVATDLVDIFPQRRTQVLTTNADGMTSKNHVSTSCVVVRHHC